MIRSGKGEPVVLLHGVTGSETMWRNVIPRLAPRYDTIALTALGHRGGRPGGRGASVQDLVDDAERSLDELGLERPHLAGNSLGGWMTIELARRGRAARLALVRRIALRDNAVHGERVTRGDLLEVIDDVLACTLRDELLSTEEQIAPLDPLLPPRPGRRYPPPATCRCSTILSWSPRRSTSPSRSRRPAYRSRMISETSHHACGLKYQVSLM